ncbi:MAG: type II toxin-antitoxin system RelE/ParE family toxin [Desulfobacterales bacterium]|nr:type II toxin-antitoxin system RelE/ParE family toxin [Desulfobacterales bacterium]
MYAIKNNQIRLYCFFDRGNIILLTHGIIKKKQKLESNDLKKANKIRNEYFNLKG